MTLGLVLPLISSCIFDYEVIVEEKQDPVMVTFTLDVLSSAATRADDHVWGDNTDNSPNNDYPDFAGDSFENKIDLSEISVIAYTASGDFMGELPILLKSEDADGKVDFVCAFPYALPNSASPSNPPTFRFMVLANCIDQRYGYSYDASGRPNLAGLMYNTASLQSIPMWGVTTYKFKYDNGVLLENQQMGSISVLRALAKVGVKLSDKLKDEGYRIKEVEGLKLNYSAANGYCVPSRWNTASETRLLQHSVAFRPVSDNLAKNVSAMGWGSQSAGYYMYVPETINGVDSYVPEDGDPKELSISVVLERDVNGKVEEIEFPYAKGIRFCDYNDAGLPIAGTDYNIVRNHFYDFTIEEINVGLKLNLKVADWEDEPVWDLDFSVPIHSNLMTAPSANAAAPTRIPTVSYDNTDESGEAGAFEGYFMMESPAGMTWRATLADASAVDYEVRIYTTDGINSEYDVLVTDDAVEAEKNKYYKIVVVAKNPNNVGNVIRLGITYTADWNAEANPLLIINKGDKGGFYYPNAGSSDIHWISIKQQ